MMKTCGVFFVCALLLAVSPVMGVPEIGRTYQCWDFDQDGNWYGMLPSEKDRDNPNGYAVAIIADMSGGQGVGWRDGAWWGPEFKIILDIPNYTTKNPYKLLNIKMEFKGEVAFSWVAEVEQGELFELLNEREEPANNDGWKTLYQEWQIKPNPREEIVVIGLKGIDSHAAINGICVETWCIPEPATLALLAFGAAALRVRKRV